MLYECTRTREDICRIVVDSIERESSYAESSIIGEATFRSQSAANKPSQLPAKTVFKFKFKPQPAEAGGARQRADYQVLFFS